jgi:hypothetical protein
VVHDCRSGAIPTAFQIAGDAERAGGANLVEAHEPRVAGNVGCHYGRQPASDPNWLFLLHRRAAPATPSVPGCRLPSLGLGTRLVNKWNMILLNGKDGIGTEDFS